MIEAFAFKHDGRTFACHVDDTPGSRRGAWWWFTVSDDGHRYAPFRAETDDTAASVGARVVAYYTEHQTRRANPTVGRAGWGRRPGAPPIKG